MSRSIRSFSGMWQSPAQAPASAPEAMLKVSPKAIEGLEQLRRVISPLALSPAPSAAQQMLLQAAALPRSGAVRQEQEQVAPAMAELPVLQPSAQPVLQPSPQTVLQPSPQPVLQSSPQPAESLERQRQKLGERLLETRPFTVGQMLRSFFWGHPAAWKEWAHQRLFALACAGQIDLSETHLQRISHSRGWWRSRQQSHLLLKILKAYAGPRLRPQAGLALCTWQPWLFAFLFERQLRKLRQDPGAKVRAAGA